MRGIFAAGVLDSFLDHNFNPFHAGYGVSAGSTNMASYLANQRGRSHRVITDYSCRPDFISAKKFVRGGHYIDLDWLWKITDLECPLDIQTLFRQQTSFHIVATDTCTGKPVYLRPDHSCISLMLKASCAMPLAYQNQPELNGIAMADGGIADSIPAQEAYRRGARHIVVILSRPEGYRKAPVKTPGLLRKYLKSQPQLAEAIIRRDENYNKALEFITSPPDDCVIETIVPPENFGVGRITTNQIKLTEGYQMGILAGLKFLSRTVLQIPGCHTVSA